MTSFLTIKGMEPVLRHAPHFRWRHVLSKDAGSAHAAADATRTLHMIRFTAGSEDCGRFRTNWIPCLGETGGEWILTAKDGYCLGRRSRAGKKEGSTLEKLGSDGRRRFVCRYEHPGVLPQEAQQIPVVSHRNLLAANEIVVIVKVVIQKCDGQRQGQGYGQQEEGMSSQSLHGVHLLGK